ncbi:hypothetical protein C8J56DRAFT_1030650 [Mycena floridula]|nr:hypothetical protein C8J56DRAFT_1030650 [Mycena floridula]
MAIRDRNRRETYKNEERGLIWNYKARLVGTWVQHNHRRLTDIRHRNYRERFARMKREGSHAIEAHYYLLLCRISGSELCSASRAWSVADGSTRTIVSAETSSRPKANRCIEDETPFAAQARGRMRTGRNVLSTWDSRLLASGRKLAIFLDPSRSPSLVVAGLLEEIKGLDEEWLSGIQSLCSFAVSPAPPTRQLRGLCSEQCAHGITSSKERMWSLKQAAVMVFEEAATIIEICTSSYTAKRQPVFRPSEKSGDYGRLGLRADE